MNPALLRFLGTILILVVGLGSGLSTPSKKEASTLGRTKTPPSQTSSATIKAIPAQPSPGTGTKTIPAIPAVPCRNETAAVTILTPNGGETFTQGYEDNSPNLITWSGKAKAYKLALVKPNATTTSDPTNLIMGWIDTYAISYENIYNWSAVYVYDNSFTNLINIDPGKYKILVVADDGRGQLTLWDKRGNRKGNFDISDQPFDIVPQRSLKILYPNGDEIFRMGQTVKIKVEAVRLDNALMVLRLFPGYNLEIAALPVDTGTYEVSWTIPLPKSPIPGVPFPSEGYMVFEAGDYEIRALSAWEAPFPMVGDSSDSTFTILEP